MNEIETTIALKSLESENSVLKSLLAQLQEAAAYRRENELVESVKGKIIAWAKWLLAIFVTATTILGITTFLGARDAAIQSFTDKTESAIRKQFDEVILPKIRTEMLNNAAKKTDELTSANAEQFDKRMDLHFEEMNRYAKANKFPALVLPEPFDTTGRPTTGYVLSNFLTKSVNDTYVVNTFRLNIRDKPN